jgi:hypothetical protein
MRQGKQIIPPPYTIYRQGNKPNKVKSTYMVYVIRKLKFMFNMYLFKKFYVIRRKMFNLTQLKISNLFFFFTCLVIHMYSHCITLNYFQIRT